MDFKVSGMNEKATFIPIASQSSAVGLICDANVSPFSASLRGSAPVPVILAYGANPLHRHTLVSEVWMHDRILSDLKPKIIRSDCFARRTDNDWSNLLICEGEGIFLHLERMELSAYASDLDTAREAAERFLRLYGNPVETGGAHFNLITEQFGGIETETVAMRECIKIVEAEMDLFYGEGFLEWSRRYLQKLRTNTGGLCILEGPPGTGKTSFIRYAMEALKETHRFYFIPPATSNLLSDPALIKFWAAEKRKFSEFRFVCVLEDADGVLMRRGLDNRREVGAILNITDGLMADFLSIHLLCSINCSSTRIDPALLRPGRLTAHRTFERRTACEARSIAEKAGLQLQEQSDYSLAEIFNGWVDISNSIEKPRVGFSA